MDFNNENKMFEQIENFKKLHSKRQDGFVIPKIDSPKEILSMLQKFYPNATNRTIIDVLKMAEVEDNQLKLSSNIAYSSLSGIKIEKIDGCYHHHTHHGVKVLSLPKLFD